MLTLIATPIGNLADISLRALSSLKNAAAILCEDTRRSSILLNHYEIQKPLYSYHKFNEKKNLEVILDRLRSGDEIALISDAGTPCLNDPGSILVAACIAEGLPFTSIPGACSPIMALLLSGFDATKFQFIGFLPKKSNETIRSILGYPGSTIAFESPERLIDSLEAIAKIDPTRQVAVCREMTKTYEECKRGQAPDVLAHFKQKGVKGEIVLLIAGGKIPAETMALDELIELVQELYGVTLKEAIKLAASLLKRPKSEIYQAIHKD
jgi:16S rRNA (cytidine1402-2'-O)-methyltransferase